MLPRVKLFLAIALSLFIPLGFLTEVRVPAQNASPKHVTVSRLIAFRPFSKVPVSSWLGATAAEAAEPELVVEIYEAGKQRYIVDGKSLTGRSEAGGDGEKILFDHAVTIVTGSPPPATSASFPLYLELASNKKPCWHLNDADLRWHPSANSIEHHRLGKLIDSTTLRVCNH